MRPFSRGAFSMAEVFLVIVIISTLSAIAVPRFSNFLVNQRLSAVSRRVISELCYAKHHAKSTGASQEIMFNDADDTITLTNLADPDHPARFYTVYLKQEPYYLKSLTPDFAGKKDVVFDGYGMPDAGGTITLVLGEYQRVITLDAGTGCAMVGATTLVP